MQSHAHAFDATTMVIGFWVLRVRVHIDVSNACVQYNIDRIDPNCCSVLCHTAYECVSDTGGPRGEIGLGMCNRFIFRAV
jgi:hypothetical protein